MDVQEVAAGHARGKSYIRAILIAYDKALADPRFNAPSFGGRQISVEWHSTPRLFVAYFTQEYDGAIDSHHPVGFGKTEQEAVADLREQAEECYGRK